MAPPPPQEDDNSNGAVDKVICLRRSPRRRVNSNIAGGRGKQKKDAPARKQLNRGTNDGEKGKRKQKEAAAVRRQGDSASDVGRDNQKKADKPAGRKENSAKGVNKNKRSIHDKGDAVEVTQVRKKIRVSSGARRRKMKVRAMPIRRKDVEVLEDCEDESDYTPDNGDNSDSDSDADDKGRGMLRLTRQWMRMRTTLMGMKN